MTLSRSSAVATPADAVRVLYTLGETKRAQSIALVVARPGEPEPAVARRAGRVRAG